MKLPFGFNIVKGSPSLTVLNKINKYFRGGNRPGIGFLPGMYATHNIYIPLFPLRLIELYQIAHYSDVLRTILRELSFQVFRRGLEVNPKFVNKCEECGNDFDKGTPQCPDCGGKTREPSQEEKRRFEEFAERANDNNQTIIEVYKSTEDDVNIVDDIFIYHRKDYVVNQITGDIEDFALKEVLRMNPVFMNFVHDRSGRLGYNMDGKPMLICPTHRETPRHAEGFCEHCKCKLQPVHYEYMEYGSQYSSDGGGKLYFIEGEIHHKSKYKPSLLRGFPPVYSVWQKIVTLINQDKYMLDYYGKQRAPKGFLFVNSRDQNALEKAWDWMLDKAKDNPHLIWPISVPSNSNRGNVAQFINFMNNLQEMQFTESRNEMRRQIGAVYGVMPIFQGDLSTSGGLNNEGLQVTVTNRATEEGQALYNGFFLKKLAGDLRIHDWDIELPPAEERDEMAELQRDHQKIINAEGMLRMGFDVSLNEESEFEFSGQASRLASLPSVPGAESTDSDAAESFGGAPERVGKGISREMIDVLKARKPEASIDRDKLQRTFDQELQKELDGIVADVKAGKKSKAFLRSKARKISERASQKLQTSFERLIKDVYKAELKNVGKDVKVDLGFGEIDQNAVKAIKEQKVFADAFSGVNKHMQGRLQDIITASFTKKGGFVLRDIVEQMKKSVELSEGQMSVIARTETTKIANAARLVGYGKADDGTFKFAWIGPSDTRTTSVCKRIKKRTEKGVSRDELLKIIEEESKKSFPDWSVNKQAPAAHVNCRHVIVRVA